MGFNNNHFNTGPIITAGTAGSVIFSDGTVYTQNSTNLFWDNTNNRLGIGTNSPTQKLEVNGNAKITGVASINGNTSLYPIGVLAEATNSIGIQISGRSSDNQSILHFVSNNQLTEYGKIQANSTGFTVGPVSSSIPLILNTNNTTRISISSSGSINIPGLTASTSVVTDASKNLISGPVLASGTYTPSWTNLSANISNFSINNATQYIRVGNIVTVYGDVTIATNSTAQAVADMTLPISSTAPAVFGTWHSGNMYIYGKMGASTTYARFTFNTGVAIGTTVCNFSFSYTIN